MKKKHILVTLDGPGGVFKTSVAIIIAEQGYQYYKTPGEPFLQFKPDIDVDANPFGRYSFFLLALISDSLRIKKLLKRGSVVCDRYSASTFAYNVAMDERIKSLHYDLKDDFKNIGLLEPDFAFLLDARPDVRNERIRIRAQKLSYLNPRRELDSNIPFLDRVAELFKSPDLNYLKLKYIDTSDLSSQEVAEEIQRQIASNGSL